MRNLIAKMLESFEVKVALAGDGAEAIEIYMKNRILSIFYFIIIVSIFSACSTDPDEKANELYVEASQIMQSAKRDAGSYSEALESYKNAKKKVERICSKYASSNVAVSLMSGQTRISGLTLSKFKEIEDSLRPLAEAEKKPLSCALLVAKTIKDESSKSRVLAEIAGKYAEARQFTQALEIAKTIKDELYKTLALAEIAVEYAGAGQKKKADQLLSQVFEIAKTIKNESSKVSVLAEIAGKYAEAGQKEKAAQLLSQALEITKTIKNESSRVSALAAIAGKYTEAGQKEKAAQLLSQALEIAKTIKLEILKTGPLFKIARKYVEAGQFTQALETAKTIKGEFYKFMVLAEITGKYGPLHWKRLDIAQNCFVANNSSSD